MILARGDDQAAHGMKAGSESITANHPAPIPALFGLDRREGENANCTVADKGGEFQVLGGAECAADLSER
jgi:hypothetical protein